MNPRAWNLAVLAGLLGTLLVLPATSHAAPPTTLTAYMRASDVSAVPSPAIVGGRDVRQVVFISVQVYTLNSVKNFLYQGVPVTGTTCTDATTERRVVTRKLGPPFPQPAIGPLAEVVGTKAFVDTAQGWNYRITSVSLTCDPNLRKVTLQLV